MSARRVTINLKPNNQVMASNLDQDQILNEIA
jgi:hypothetical protein